MEISVVIPVYGCVDCLQQLHRRLVEVLSGIVDSYEIVFVDDRSPDDAWAFLRRLVCEDNHVRAIRLSRNFGQHRAITAGIAESSGRWVVVMDCDLQDPPEEIPRLYARAQEGFEIVFAKRLSRRLPLRRRVGNRAYFWLRKTLAGVDLETEYANLSIMSRKAADAFLSLKDVHRNFLLILSWLGFEHASIEFEQPERFAGRSSYTFRGLLRVAFDALFFHTTVLLVWIVYLGFGVAFASLALAVFFVASHFAQHSYPGWTSIIVILLLIGGFIIISLGVAAMYIGKVFEQVKERPLFLVDERLGARD